MLALPYPFPRPTRRLIAALAVSVLVHLMLALGFSPKTARYVPPLPLQVEIRRETAPERAAEIPAEQPSELTARPVAVEPPPAAPPREESSPAPAALPVAVAPGLPLDRYYTARELDVRAEQINDVDLVYPRRAYETRTKGRVVLRIFINERGAIDDVSIVEAVPAGVFDEAALTATQALRFKPAIKNGRNVKSQKTIEVVLDPYESINIP